MGNKILIVDYDEETISFLVDLLSKKGYDVITATDGLEALDRFSLESPQLVLLSAMLPKLHGFHVCKAIKRMKKGEETPVLVMSNIYKSSLYKYQAIKEFKADDFLLKPLDEELLLQRIQFFLSQRNKKKQERDTLQIKKISSLEKRLSSHREQESGLEDKLEKTLASLMAFDEISSPRKSGTGVQDDVLLESNLEDTLVDLMLPKESDPEEMQDPLKELDSRSTKPKEAESSTQSKVLPASREHLAAPPKVVTPDQAAASTRAVRSRQDPSLPPVKPEESASPGTLKGKRNLLSEIAEDEIDRIVDEAIFIEEIEELDSSDENILADVAASDEVVDNSDTSNAAESEGHGEQDIYNNQQGDPSGDVDISREEGRDVSGFRLPGSSDIDPDADVLADDMSQFQPGDDAREDSLVDSMETTKLSLSDLPATGSFPDDEDGDDFLSLISAVNLDGNNEESVQVDLPEDAQDGESPVKEKSDPSSEPESLTGERDASFDLLGGEGGDDFGEQPEDVVPMSEDVAEHPSAHEPGVDGEVQKASGRESEQLHQEEDLVATIEKLKDEALRDETDRNVAPVADQGIAEESGASFGKYVILEKIAIGGMAEIFKAKQRGVEGFEKLVVIKRILPHLTDNIDFVSMFIDEGKIAAQLTHQNIAQIYELGEEQGYYYIAMEYVHGKDLRTLMEKVRQENLNLSIEHSALIISKLCRGLDYAHRKKDFEGRDLHIVHRDISPQNVLISYEGEVKIIDFGIAKAAAQDHHTRAGALKGKILYMSPEQAWGKNIDKRSDIFSLGTLLYEMITQKRLFLAPSEIQILQKVREAEIIPPRQINETIPEELEKIAMKALARKRDERYHSAGEMLRDLDTFLYSRDVKRSDFDLAKYMLQLFQEESDGGALEISETEEDDREQSAAAPKEVIKHELEGDTVATRQDARRSQEEGTFSDDEWLEAEIKRLLSDEEPDSSLKVLLKNPVFYVIIFVFLVLIAYFFFGDMFMPASSDVSTGVLSLPIVGLFRIFPV